MDGIIYQAVRNNVQCNYWFRNFIETEGIGSLKNKNRYICVGLDSCLKILDKIFLQGRFVAISNNVFNSIKMSQKRYRVCSGMTINYMKQNVYHPYLCLQNNSRF